MAGTQAVDRAAQVLLAVIDAAEPPTPGEIQAATGLAKSTLSRLVGSLERHCLVSRDPDGRVRPGVALQRYAHSSRRDDDLRALADPHLHALAEATGETVNLAVLVDGEVEQLAQVDSRYFLGSVNWVGQRVPLHCSAQGKVFLAAGAELPPGPLERRTSNTICDRAALADEVRRHRDRGWALADGELEPGLVALAAPILERGGDVVAALSVSGPSLRLHARIDDVAGLLTHHAARLSQDLGWQPPRKASA
jgi:DNA-binding IclR family transcriptional regulator